MESLEGQKIKIRSDISVRLDALEDLLTEELTWKLSQRMPNLYHKDSNGIGLMALCQEISPSPLKNSIT